MVRARGAWITPSQAGFAALMVLQALPGEYCMAWQGRSFI